MHLKLISFASIALLIQGCSTSNQTQNEVSKRGLKDYFGKYFDMGVAVDMRSLSGQDSALIVREFNSVTPENALKIGPVHPTEEGYNWKNGDAIVAFAQQNQLKIRGHNLLWHYESQTPKWIFKNKDGSTASKELVLQRLKDHITTVVSRYKGKIYAWDVANEVISDQPNEYLRPSEWLKICGEEYISKAYQWAHEADPAALLFYNDYNEINPQKRAKIYRLVNSLQQAGVPIHGVGLQAHWAINEPSRSQLDTTLQQFAQLNIPIHITELDISVYPKEHSSRAASGTEVNTTFTSQKEAAQLQQYKMCFELFKKYKNNISSVTFWNLSDRYSWLDNFPVKNRKDYPLLFDEQLNPKKAYWEVLKVADK